MKVSLVRAFNWTLNDIAQTDIESLFGFLEAYTEEGRQETEGGGQMGRRKRMAYADEVKWL